MRFPGGLLREGPAERAVCFLSEEEVWRSAAAGKSSKRQVPSLFLLQLPQGAALVAKWLLQLQALHLHSRKEKKEEEKDKSTPTEPDPLKKPFPGSPTQKLLGCHWSVLDHTATVGCKGIAVFRGHVATPNNPGVQLVRKKRTTGIG